MNTQTLKRYRARAVDFRAQNEPLPADGFIYFHRGKPCGWTLVLDRPKSFEPGVYFVPPADGAIFVTTGGDTYGGAEKFMEVAP